MPSATNFGSCVFDTGQEAFRCQCASWRSGPNCETLDSESVCRNVDCGNGVCEPLIQNLDQPTEKIEPNCVCDFNYRHDTTVPKPYPCTKTINFCAVPVGDAPKCANGNCIEVPSQSSHRCDCHDCWQGDSCSVPIELCSDDSCDNGAQCQMTDDCSTTVCLCRDQCFIGPTCSLRQDACVNAGDGCLDCTETDGCSDFTCTCKTCFEGPKCDERKNVCDHDLCLNGSKCDQNDECDEFICSGCPPFFEGQFCERRIDFCASNPCQNGSTCGPSDECEEKIDVVILQGVY